jgi:hypothetical protein
MKMDLDVHVQVSHKAIRANGEKNDTYIINLFCFTLREWGVRVGREFL